MRKTSSFISSLMCCWLVTFSFCLQAQEKTKVVAVHLEPKGAYSSPQTLEEKSTNFFMSKRFKTATHQRDSLYLLGQKLQEDTTLLGGQKRALDLKVNALEKNLKACKEEFASMLNSNTTLKKKYEDLETTSLSKLQALKSELDEKAVQQELLEQQLSAREQRVRELEQILRRQDSTVRAITQAIKDVLKQVNSPELSVEMRNGKVYVSMSDKILFESGRSEVQEQGIKAIAKIADVLNRISNVEIMVEGHTDNVPIKTPQYRDNWDLSVARSTAITRLLIEMGVTPKRITASGKAEFSPKASNLDKEGRAKNRRTEIVLIPNLDELYQIINTSSSSY